LSLSLSAAEDRSPSSQIVGTAGPSAGTGQILSGIGSLASGLRIGGTPPHGDPSMLMAPTPDLQAFVAFAIGGAGKDPRRRDRKKDREGADPGPVTAVTLPAPAGPASVATAYAERDGVVAGSVKALWTGRVADLLKMREDLDDPTLGSDNRRRPGSIRSNSDFDKKYSSTRWKRRDRRSGLPIAVVSDGDADDHPNSYHRERRHDGRSTEEESDVFVSPGHSHPHPFSGMWGGRMRGKLGNWAAYVFSRSLSFHIFR